MISRTKLKKKKIVHVLHSVGGVEVYLRILTQNIDYDRFDLVVVQQLDLNKEAFTDNTGKELVCYDIPIQREINIFKDLNCIIKTIKIIVKEKPDVIHAHSAKGGIIARLAAIFYNVPVLHTPHAYSYLSTKSKPKYFIFLTIERIFRRLNSYLLATSESERKRGIQDVGYKLNKTFMVNNSISPIINTINIEELKEIYNLPPKYICTVGRPSFQKNIEMMVDVIFELKKSVADIHLVIMGVGEYSPNKDNVERKIIQLELDDNITLINWIDREKILAIIKNSELYVSTSRYEGLPYSIIESLALSKACVVTDCDGNIDLVKNGYNGYIVEQGDLKVMAKKIEELYLNENIRKIFGAASLEMFARNFNIERNISSIENIYLKF